MRTLLWPTQRRCLLPSPRARPRRPRRYSDPPAVQSRSWLPGHGQHTPATLPMHARTACRASLLGATRHTFETTTRPALSTCLTSQTWMSQRSGSAKPRTAKPSKQRTGGWCSESRRSSPTAAACPCPASTAHPSALFHPPPPPHSSWVCSEHGSTRSVGRPGSLGEVTVRSASVLLPRAVGQWLRGSLTRPEPRHPVAATSGRPSFRICPHHSILRQTTPYQPPPGHTPRAAEDWGTA